MKIVVDQQKAVIDWVAQRIPQVGAAGFGPASSMGVVSEQGYPMAGAVYHNYRPAHGTVMISFAADSPRWATRNIISLILGYPFHELGVHKVSTAAPHTNDRALRLNRGVGFVMEGTLKDEFGRGTHAVMFRMFARDYARLYEQPAHRRAA